jgi:NADPH:quinone reductase-like Zn-dependent oxidoreductase
MNDDAAMERAKSFITKGLASGQLKPLIERVFRLDQIQEATRFLESNAQVGKIAISV